MHTIVLLLGSNQGDRKALLQQAEKALENQVGSCTKKSSVYETAAWGFESPDLFLNQVLVFETPLEAQAILKQTQEIEKQLGRKARKENGYVSRSMDIDLLFYDNLIIQETDLQIPHPQLHKRRFTLEPLAEIIPEYTHPLLKQTISALLTACPDQLNVKKLDN